MSYIFVDEKEKAFGVISEGHICKLNFYSDDLNNIYRGRVKNKIDSLKAYFVEYDKGKDIFLNSSIPYKLGDNVIIQYVKDGANGKLPLGSLNFTIENDAYEVRRFPLRKRPYLKEGKTKDKKKSKDLRDLKERLINEEKFYPTPKLLYKRSELDRFLEANRDMEVKKVDLVSLKEFNDLVKVMRDKKVYHDNYSIIIDELETLTVIDVNSSSQKSKNNKDKYLENINLSLVDTIAFELSLRNIGGMVVIDFLRNKDQERIEEAMVAALDRNDLPYRSYGFSQMGLFELSIERRGDSLTKELAKRKLI